MNAEAGGPERQNGEAERGLWIDPAHGADLAAFVDRVLRLDDSAVIRLRERGDGLVVAWTATGFDVLASRVVTGRIRPTDLCAGADALASGLAAKNPSGYIEPGFPMDSAWRSALPSDSGFRHVDDVPAREVLALAERGAELSREGGAHGPPVSLLDQEVLRVNNGTLSVGVPMRCVFALTAMGFVDAHQENEFVRVRSLPTWLRIDARFGSVFRRRGEQLQIH